MAYNVPDFRHFTDASLEELRIRSTTQAKRADAFFWNARTTDLRLMWAKEKRRYERTRRWVEREQRRRLQRTREEAVQ